MKMKVLYFGLWVAAFCFLSAAQGAEPPKSRTLKLLLLKDAPPLSQRDATGNFVGFNVDLGRLLCETIKVPCEFQEAEHAKIMDLIANGDVDAGMISLIITPERAKRVLFTEPYRISKTFWISRIPLARSKKSRVAVVNGSVQHKWAERNGAHHGWLVVPVAVNSELSKSLRDGRADAVISPSSTALEIMKEKDLNQAGLRAHPIESEEFNNPVAIAVNPADKALCDQLNAALKQIKTSGQLDSINSKYFSFRVF